MREKEHAGFLTGLGFVLPVAAFLVCALSAQNLRDEVFLAKARKGFTEIYNLDYDEAATTFAALRREHPQHPAPPLYTAAVIWLRELFERQELDLDRFITPGYFSQPTERQMAVAHRQAFFSSLEESRKLCQDVLSRDSRHQDARYFLGSAHGILGSFAITIDRSVRQAFSHGKQAYRYHHALIQEDPQYYDAYMSVGLYEYIVDNIPWYIKWLAILIGYRGSEERGFQYLGLAAEKGRFVADDARLLQMVLYVHEGRNAQALENARRLHQKYPRSYILHLNQAQILERMGRRDQAATVYREILTLAESGRPNYQKLPLPAFRYPMGKRFLRLQRLEWALEQFQKAAAHPQTPEREKALSHLASGQLLDQAGKRKEALEHYQEVLRLPDVEDSHARARQYLKEPFKAGTGQWSMVTGG